MIYRKRGRVARWEHGRVIVVSEAGEAIEEQGVFEVRQGDVGGLAHEVDIDIKHVSSRALARDLGGRVAREARLPPTQVPRYARNDTAANGRAESEMDAFTGKAGSSYLEGLASDDVARVANDLLRHHPERLIVSHGIAEHECNGVRWQEETRRIHVSLTKKGIRVLIDRADFDLDPIERIARALGRSGAERDAPQRIRLAPNVAAALLPSLVGVAPPNVELWQTGGGFDGNGEEIHDFRVAPATPPASSGTTGATWPNVFRPSYRFRPIRVPLNLRLECQVDLIDRDIPEAIALLAPVAGLILRVLVVDGRRVYPATIRVTRIDAVAGERTWYPYGAGAFGSEIML